ncbi:hypothetical protein DFH29DRAFT_164523 [Suillus ampliporus]|nr:hypothetical protein DFH29DRAFT_164523 [Suillus ampliporus]
MFSDPDAITMDSSLNLTVHNYSNDERPTLSYSDAILELGHDLAHAASSNLGWRDPSVSFNARLFELRHDRLHQFSASPPQVPTARRTHVLKDWGVPPSPSDDEEFALEALEEFVHTKPEASPARPAQKRYAPPDSRIDLRDRQSRDITHYMTSSTDQLSLEPPTKRPRYDVASIANVIPQPHFVAGPSVDFPPLDRERLKPYRKSEMSLIPPYDVASIELFMNTLYNRAAWLIPVRGNLPWNHAACATILEPSQVSQRGVSPQLPSGPVLQHDGTSRITWTHHSIVHFWKFMISIQEAKNLGPISLSFHTAPSDITFSLDSTLDLTGGGDNQRVRLAQLRASDNPSDGFSDQLHHARLEATDYIKVYHDVKCSLFLRNILDAYQYIPEGTTTNLETGGSVTKIRVLKGARLVLIDDLARAVFTV